MRGVTADDTARVEAGIEARRHESELAHLSRVAMLGQLSGSLAHELNQPLTAILSNAQAALRFLKSDAADLQRYGNPTDIVTEPTRRQCHCALARCSSVVKRTGPLDLNS